MSKTNTFREKMAETFANAKDVILDASILRVTGNCEVIVENYKGLIEFSDKKICVKANPNPITIKGNRLELSNISDDILYVTGEIFEIFLGKEDI